MKRCLTSTRIPQTCGGHQDAMLFGKTTQHGERDLNPTRPASKPQLQYRASWKAARDATTCVTHARSFSPWDMPLPRMEKRFFGGGGPVP